jgi:DNA-binding FadR family transcriptional regulator
MPLKKVVAKFNPHARRPRLRLHGTIARDLGIRIVSRRLKPGDLLDNEIAASERLRVSRTAYREAVRILSAKGLVHSRPKVGTRVSDPEKWQLLDPDVLSWIFEFEPDDKLLADLFELRRMIEPAAAGLAATRRTHAHLDRMRRALDEMGKHTLAVEAGQLADREFHSILLSASENAFVITLTSGIAAAVAWTTIFKQRRAPMVRDAVPDHERVYEAIAAADPGAAQKAMHTLIDLAYADTKISRAATSRSRSSARGG